MRAASRWTLILVLGSMKYNTAAQQPAEADTPPILLNNEELFLSDYIKNNRTEEARYKSRVLPFGLFGVDAYSGYITINNTTNSNLFFLLTVDKENASYAPLLLWTQGGPGQSALFGQFLQNGPLAFNYTQNIHGFPFTPRNITLQTYMSIIYLDLPVGAGFSFTEDNAGYSTSLEQISGSVMEFLRQFLELFPWYVCRDFYIAGESYAARYSVAIADALRTHEISALLQLKGIIGGNGFLGPILEIADSSDFLYWTSMLNKTGRQEFSKRFKLMKSLKSPENDSLILGILLNTIFAYPKGMNTSLFQDLTSYNDHASPLYTERPQNMMQCFYFLSYNSTVKQMFHVGQNRVFEYFNSEMITRLTPDYLTDISNTTQRVLNNSKVLLYTGQLDALFPSVNQRRYYSTLNWTYSKMYRTTQRTPWCPWTWDPRMGYAGFIKQVPNFTEAMLLGMSHYGAAEKPDEVYYLMMDFIFNWTRNK